MLGSLWMAHTLLWFLSPCRKLTREGFSCRHILPFSRSTRRSLGGVILSPIQHYWGALYFESNWETIVNQYLSPLLFAGLTIKVMCFQIQKMQKKRGNAISISKSTEDGTIKKHILQPMTREGNNICYKTFLEWGPLGSSES